MRIVIAGGTGFIGKAMLRAWATEHTLEVLTRSPERAQPSLPQGVRAVGWDGETLGDWMQRLEAADALINLAGETIAQRWTPAVKQRLWDSRVRTTALLTQAVQQTAAPPRIMLQASAIGVYDQNPQTVADEDSPPGQGFLAELGTAWEAAAQLVAERGVRLCYMRIGVVLGEGGGALERMLTPFKLGVGGPIGSGNQWLSWIHLDDVVGAAAFLLQRDDLSGAFNFTAPNPVTMREFAQALGRVLLRPAVLPTPAFALRLILGEAAEFLLQGSRALPKRLQAAGYEFRFPTLEAALRNLLEK
ncbi:MAG: TIGR01777 family oxidoreductase [Fimbriimonadales bacterium]|nr:TIGR01777 family oxidoreductase [Fimbriimonadales bacterium]